MVVFFIQSRLCLLFSREINKNTENLQSSSMNFKKAGVQTLNPLMCPNSTPQQMFVTEETAINPSQAG